MKFQHSSFHRSKVTESTKSMTDQHTLAHTRQQQYASGTFFKVGGGGLIKMLWHIYLVIYQYKQNKMYFTDLPHSQ